MTTTQQVFTTYVRNGRRKTGHYLLWHKGGARPWRLQSCTTGQFLGAFKTAENARRNLDDYLAWAEETVTRVVEG